jgi:hypothetical protein
MVCTWTRTPVVSIFLPILPMDVFSAVPLRLEDAVEEDVKECDHEVECGMMTRSICSIDFRLVLYSIIFEPSS